MKATPASPRLKGSIDFHAINKSALAKKSKESVLRSALMIVEDRYIIFDLEILN